jgi:transcriptional repressor NrdR
MPAVVKNDGRRENFNREKIMGGLKKACQKRPISMDQLEALINNVEESLCEGHPQEVDSQRIGPLVMEQLYRLDPVSYVRFASFYWEYKDVADFVKNLESNSHPYLNPTQKLRTEVQS